MATFSKAYIKINSMETVKNAIENYYTVLVNEFDNMIHDYRFFENGNDTIILASNYNEDWVEISLNYPSSLYFHDELLRRLSRDLNTDILLGYFQSTDAEGRLAKFKQGTLELSVIQCDIQYGNETESHIRLMDNWGVTDEVRKAFSIPKLNEEYRGIYRDVIYSFYNMFGLIWDGKERTEVKYLHLEINYK